MKIPIERPTRYEKLPYYKGLELSPRPGMKLSYAGNEYIFNGKDEVRQLMFIWILIRAKGKFVSSQYLFNFLFEHETEGKIKESSKPQTVTEFKNYLNKILNKLTNGKFEVVSSNSRGYALKVNE